MEEISNIIDGWKNIIFPTKESKELAFNRAKECSKCPKNKLGICTACGCPIIAAIRSIDKKCPLDKW